MAAESARTHDACELKLPKIGLGTSGLKGEACSRMVEAALREGCRLIDTASIYENEEAVGKGIARSGVVRGDVCVITKLWFTDMHTADSVKEAFGRSLSKLGLEYVDVYLIHWPSDNTQRTTAVEATEQRRMCWRVLEELHANGLVRHLGVSNFSRAHLRDSLVPKPRVAPRVHQFELHPWIFTDTTRRMLDFCAEEDIAVIASASFGKGALLHKPEIKKVAEQANCSPAAVLLRWCTFHGAVVIPKTTSVERLRANMRAVDMEQQNQLLAPLDDLVEEWGALGIQKTLRKVSKSMLDPCISNTPSVVITIPPPLAVLVGRALVTGRVHHLHVDVQTRRPHLPRNFPNPCDILSIVAIQDTRSE